jgi:hypothetical protein
MAFQVHDALWAEIVKVFNNSVPGGLARPILNAIDRPELVSKIEAVAGVVEAVAGEIAHASDAPQPE